MLIYYCAKKGAPLLLEYGESPESEVLKEFAEHEDVHSYEVLEVEVPERVEFFADDAERHVYNHLAAKAA